MLKLSELANRLAEKHNLSSNKINEFLTALIEQIHEGLHSDGSVKIKGLGTFKIIQVKDRESINVNTGERVVIYGHEKISFTPDSFMKDLVNRPFAHFEVVEVQDGVSFNDIENNTEDMEEETIVEEEVAPIADIIESDNQADSIEEKVEMLVPQVEENTIIEEEKEEQTEEKKSMNRMKGLLIAAISLIIGFGLGFSCCYFALMNVVDTIKDKEEISLDSITPTVQDTTITDIDTIATVVEKEKPHVEAEKPAVTSQEDLQKQYEAKYPEIRYGAYRIGGVAQTVKVQKGQTLKSISKAYLGPDMHCYVMAINDGITEVKEGQMIKIPKLKTKKPFKKR